jgi:hypothetical protein
MLEGCKLLFPGQSLSRRSHQHKPPSRGHRQPAGQITDPFPGPMPRVHNQPSQLESVDSNRRPPTATGAARKVGGMQVLLVIQS